MKEHNINVLLFFFFTCTDQNSSTPAMTTVHPPVTLTTILMSTLQPEYEKLPTLKPVSDSLENTTIMASTTNAPSTTSYTIVRNQTSPFQPTSTMDEATTESVDKLTTDYKTGEFIRLCHYVHTVRIELINK